MQPRFIIGIDLGTTNSAVSFVDTQSRHGLQQFSIPQMTKRGVVEGRPALPSFCLLPINNNLSYVVGEFAREEGAMVPTRLVFSAKSWLCNAAADRTDRILPPNGDEAIRISPVEATRRYLDHIRNAWNRTIAKHDLEAEMESQEVVLTVPASFDEVARTLTAKAAKEAGLAHVTLLEEPQAAFYEWIHDNDEQWRDLLKAGERIIVCDVGGGTTDFSLIEVTEKEDGLLGFQRLAVGDHLLLGGDNMDAFLAHKFAARLDNPELSSTQWLQLRHEARKAKEVLLSETSSHSTYPLHLQAAGSRVVGGSFSLEVAKDDLQKLLLDGFFGIYPRQEALKLTQRSGMRAMGLPYEEEPSITKHLARFLFQHGQLESAPDYLLFNGGTMKPEIFQNAIVKSIGEWYGREPKILQSPSLDLSVSRGAAYYGRVRRGLGIRIGGGTPRTYYLKLDVQDASGQIVGKALTLLPKGSEEGACYESEHTFHLVPNRPASFQLMTSHVRLNDAPGHLVEISSEEMQALPPLITVIRFGKGENKNERIPVKLGLSLTPLGTLELWLSSKKTNHRWNLEFQVRKVTGQDDALASLGQERRDEVFDSAHLDAAKSLITSTFKEKLPSGKLIEQLEQQLQNPKTDWVPSVLRGLADALLDAANDRKTNSALEIRWWNTLGYCLRPGCGYPLDDHRIQRLWKILLSETSNDKELQVQRLIMLRRISGGLSKGQQTQLANALISIKMPKVLKGLDLTLFTERMRALASFERLDQKLKLRIADALLQRITTDQAIDAEYWALGRLGTRHLLFASLPNIIPAETVSRWVEQLISLPTHNLERLVFPLGQMSCQTEHPEVNIPDFWVNKIDTLFAGSSLEARLRRLQQPQSDIKGQGELFGDSLPAGLLLIESLEHF